MSNVKTFIVTAPKECRPIGEMKNPEVMTVYDQHDLNPLINSYNDYIKSLPRYPILSSNNYEVGESFDGKVVYQMTGKIDQWEDVSKEDYDHLRPMYKIVFVIPVQQDKEDKPDELNEALNDNMFMTGGNTDAEKDFYSMGFRAANSISEKEIKRLKGFIEMLWKYGELDGSYEDYKKENNL